MRKRGAKHSPPVGKFQKSERPPAAVVETHVHLVSYGQIVFKRRILDIDYDDFRRRFQLCPPQVLNQSAEGETLLRFSQNLGDLQNIVFLKSSFMKSCGVKCHPW